MVVVRVAARVVRRVDAMSRRRVRTHDDARRTRERASFRASESSRGRRRRRHVDDGMYRVLGWGFVVCVS
jgi:hypothetical protein